MNQAQKIALISNIVNNAYPIAESHGFSADDTVEEVTKLLSDMLTFTLEHIQAKKADYITKIMVATLHSANVTEADISFFRLTRDNNKSLVRLNVLRVLENSAAAGLPLTMKAAKDELLKVLSGQTSAYFSEAESATLLAAQIKPVDMENLFNHIMVSGIDTLLAQTTLTPRAALEFFARLEKTEQTKVSSLIEKQQNKILNLFQTELIASKKFESILPDFAVLLHGEDSNNAQLSLAFAQLDYRFKGILATGDFLLKIQMLDIPYLGTRLAQQSDLFVNSVANQTVAGGNRLLSFFKQWTSCNTAAQCPASINLPIADYQDVKINYFTSMLAKAIVEVDGQNAEYGGTRQIRDFNSAEAKVNALPTEANRAVYFATDYFRSHMLNHTNLQEIDNILSSPGLCRNLVKAINRIILESQASSALYDYSKQLPWNNPVACRQMVQTLETWMNCFIISQHSDQMREACLALWNSTTTLLLNITNLPALAEGSVAMFAGPTMPSHIHGNSLPEHARHDYSMLGVVQSGLMLGGLVCTAAVMYTRFFKPKKPAKEVHLQKPRKEMHLHIVTESREPDILYRPRQ
jgi:hypothetical protein